MPLAYSASAWDAGQVTGSDVLRVLWAQAASSPQMSTTMQPCFRLRLHNVNSTNSARPKRANGTWFHASVAHQARLDFSKYCALLSSTVTVAACVTRQIRARHDSGLRGTVILVMLALTAIECR